MPQNKPHLYYTKQATGATKLRQPTRYPGNGEEQETEEDEIIDYTPKREDFIRSRDSFFAGRQQRIAQRNNTLSIPSHVEYILITFHNSFDSSVFENRYRNNFGLSASSYTEFNTVGLFAIVSPQLFQAFIDQINIFINTEDHEGEVEYNPDIKYIKEFTFFTSDLIIQYSQFKPHIIINLIDNVEIFQDYILPIEKSLIEYLTKQGITFFDDSSHSKIELLNIDEHILQEIADNFDTIQSINSYAAGIVRPNSFNLVERTFGFEISNTTENLPIIGIIDTGISNQTPLAGLIINEGNEFDLTNSSPVIDATSHGTAVAGLAALGERLQADHTGIFEADAKLLSLKVLDANNGYIPETEVIRLIKEANAKYGVKLFTLTIGYTDPKSYNDTISEYAYTLDILTYELDILIFISIGNINNLQHFDGHRFVTLPYPGHFDNEAHNLFAPAESMNSITVGAAAGNFEGNDQICISPDGSFPAIYTRTHHVSWNHPSINKTRINKRLYKPDVCHFAGDYDAVLSAEQAGLKVISTIQGHFYERQIGTSYATPLTANVAAKLLRHYPELYKNMQTIKALVLNGAMCEKIDETFIDLQNIRLKSIYGNGIPDTDYTLFSDDNKVTFILEDSINLEEIKSYELIIPKYLLQVNRKNSVLHVDATLCFKFLPVGHNHLAYCPLHIAFGVFRNLPLEEYKQIIEDEKSKTVAVGINDNSTKNYVFNESWSQDYYYKAKMLSNAQKVSFNISKKTLVEEDCKLKIAVNAKLHRLLSPYQKRNYEGAHPFSIVFTIRENPIKGRNTNKLYAELEALNELQAIAVSDLEAEGSS